MNIEGGRSPVNESPGSGGRLSGAVVEQLPQGLYRVKLDAGSMVTAHLAGRLDRNFIRLLVGDRVQVELSSVDPGRGRVVGKVL